MGVFGGTEQGGSFFFFFGINDHDPTAHNIWKPDHVLLWQISVQDHNISGISVLYQYPDFVETIENG